MSVLVFGAREVVECERFFYSFILLQRDLTLDMYVCVDRLNNEQERFTSYHMAVAMDPNLSQIYRRITPILANMSFEDSFDHKTEFY